MQLPPAPSQYSLTDQDMIRKFLQEGLDGYLDRIFTLEQAPAVVPPPPPGDGTKSLRLGLAHSGVLLGKGPAGTTGPIYPFVQELSVTNTQLNTYIAAADEHDVTFMFGPSGGRAGFLDANGVFSRKLYQDKVRRYESNAVLADAINRQRVLLFVIDEAQHPSYNGTCNPDDVNWMGNLHKKIWPGALTFVRMGTNTMLTGWNGKGIPTNGWTGIDYGWEQRASRHNNESLSTFYTGRKAKLANVGLGMIPGLNLWAGGVRPGEVIGGVSACWDADFTGSSNKIIVGMNNNGSDHADFERVACNNFGDSTVSVTSPDLIRAVSNFIVNDPDFPFFMLWTYPLDSSLGPSSETAANTLLTRADYVAALSDSIEVLNARATYNGLRTAKPGDTIFFVA